MKAFVISQFWYCRLIKMFHIRVFNDKNDKHYRVLRTTYGDISSLLQDLLKTMTKFIINVSPKVMKEIFEVHMTYIITIRFREGK